MLSDLLSKNPEQVNSKIENILEQNLLNIIYYENSFAKAKFLTKTIEIFALLAVTASFIVS